MPLMIMTAAEQSQFLSASGKISLRHDIPCQSLSAREELRESALAFEIGGRFSKKGGVVAHHWFDPSSTRSSDGPRQRQATVPLGRCPARVSARPRQCQPAQGSGQARAAGLGDFLQGKGHARAACLCSPAEAWAPHWQRASEEPVRTTRIGATSPRRARDVA